MSITPYVRHGDDVKYYVGESMTLYSWQWHNGEKTFPKLFLPKIYLPAIHDFDRLIHSDLSGQSKKKSAIGQSFKKRNSTFPQRK